jgi:hypothetical protein
MHSVHLVVDCESYDFLGQCQNFLDSKYVIEVGQLFWDGGSMFIHMIVYIYLYSV